MKIGIIGPAIEYGDVSRENVAAVIAELLGAGRNIAVDH